MSIFPQVTLPDPLPPLMSATDLRDLLGLGAVDPPTDAQIEFAAEVASAVLRNYLGRSLTAETYVDAFPGAYPSAVLSLSEYPVATLTEVEVAGVIYPGSDFKVKKNSGVTYAPASFSAGETVTVTYDAGYTVLPFDLQAVVLELVRKQLGAMGLPTGAVTTDTPVKSVAIGALRVDYAIASSAEGTKGVQSAALSDVLNAYEDTLNPYRHSRALGGTP